MPVKPILLLVTIVSLIACGAESPTPDTQVLRRGLSAVPASLDPVLARSVASAVVLSDLHEGLLTRDADGKLALGLAESWAWSPDRSHLRFVLRPDLRWSDGRPLVAGDFVRAWQMLVAPETGAFYADLLAPVARLEDGLLHIDAVDERHFNVYLESPVADFPERLAHPALSPRAADPLLTSGAYKIASGRSDTTLELVRNPNYHGADTVAIDVVTYTSFDDEQTEYATYRSGDLDITSRVPRQLFRGDVLPPDLRRAPYFGVVYLSFNMREPLPRETRRALSAAIDRETLATLVVGRGEQPAFSLVPSGMANGDLTYEPLPTKNDVAASTTMPSEIKINYATSEENRVVALAVQQMWREQFPTLEVVIENQEFRVLLAASREGRFEGLVRNSWIADYDDPLQFLSLLTTGAPSNSAGYSNSTFDAVIAAARVETDAENRADLLQQAETIIFEDAPVIPLYFFVAKHLVHARIAGWQDNALDVHLSRHLTITPMAGG
ncbi:MAG: peptide ABC transporter substrate-binding protein [Pseudomonadota bacterium]